MALDAPFEKLSHVHALALQWHGCSIDHMQIE